MHEMYMAKRMAPADPTAATVSMTVSQVDMRQVRPSGREDTGSTAKLVHWRDNRKLDILGSAGQILLSPFCWRDVPLGPI